MAEEMMDHVYVAKADDNRVFVQDFIPAASLPGAAAVIYSKPAYTSGMARESFKVIVIDDSGAAAGVWTIQERVGGVWVDKSSIGSVALNINDLNEHNADEQIRECRIKVTFSVNPDGNPPGTTTTGGSNPVGSGKKIGLYMEITGRRDV